MNMSDIYVRDKCTSRGNLDAQGFFSVTSVYKTYFSYMITNCKLSVFPDD